jgi:hypothetical protein
MKKALGYLLIVIASILGLVILSQLAENIAIICNKISEGDIGYSIGYILAEIAMGAFVYALCRYGIKLTKNPPVKNNNSSENDLLSDLSEE